MSHPPVPVEAEFTLLRKRLNGIQLRKATRHHCALATLCYVTFADGGPRHTAWAGNLSENGIGFYLDRALEPNTKVGLRLNGPLKGSVSLQARVVHATAQADGTWCIGCEFTTRLEPDTLDDLL